MKSIPIINMLDTGQIFCPKCGKVLTLLSLHLKNTHNMTKKQIKQYVLENPDICFVSLQGHNKHSENAKKVIMNNPNIMSEMSKRCRELHPNQVSEMGVKANLIMKKRDPEKYYNDRKRSARLGGLVGGKVTQQRHPDLAKEIGKKVHILYPNLASATQKRLKKENLEKYINDRKKWGELAHKLHPTMWQPGIEYLNKNSPFKYMGVGWQYSKIQRDISQLHFELFGIPPISGINCQIYYSGTVKGEHDFKVLGFIYEPHSLNQPCRTHYETKNEYYVRKRYHMNNNGHKHHELIVTTERQEAFSMLNWLAKKVPEFISQDVVEEVDKWRNKHEMY